MSWAVVDPQLLDPHRRRTLSTVMDFLRLPAGRDFLLQADIQPVRDPFNGNLLAATLAGFKYAILRALQITQNTGNHHPHLFLIHRQWKGGRGGMNYLPLRRP